MTLPSYSWICRWRFDCWWRKGWLFWTVLGVTYNSVPVCLRQIYSDTTFRPFHLSWSEVFQLHWLYIQCWRFLSQRNSTYELNHQNQQNLADVLGSDVTVAPCKHSRAGKVQRIQVLRSPTLLELGNTESPVVSLVTEGSQVHKYALSRGKSTKMWTRKRHLPISWAIST